MRKIEPLDWWNPSNHQLKSACLFRFCHPWLTDWLADWLINVTLRMSRLAIENTKASLLLPLTSWHPLIKPDNILAQKFIPEYLFRHLVNLSRRKMSRLEKFGKRSVENWILLSFLRSLWSMKMIRPCLRHSIDSPGRGGRRRRKTRTGRPASRKPSLTSVRLIETEYSENNSEKVTNALIFSPFQFHFLVFKCIYLYIQNYSLLFLFLFCSK